jgi:hypothetical protein
MTYPLPTSQTKPGTSPERSLDGQGLFQFQNPANGAQLAPFESLIPKDDPSEQREKELEEAEAAKKRRKAQDAAMITAQTQQQNPLDTKPQADAEISNQPTQQTEQPHSESLTPATQSLKQKENQDNAEQEIEAEISSEKKEADSTYSNILDKGKNTADGMENAGMDDEMISLKTVDEMQGGQIPGMGRESSITSVSRLASVAALDRSAVTSVSGDTADSNFSQLTSGNPSLPTPSEARSQSASPTAKATSLLKSLPIELEKFKQSGQSQIQLDLPVGENESVRIRLNIRAGEIRSTFITESPELREALQKAWPEFTATHRSPTLQFGESNFQDGLSRQNDAAFDQGRRRQYQQDADFQTTGIKPFTVKPQQQNPSNTTRQGQVNLWA